jgi:hypothetical protein
MMRAIVYGKGAIAIFLRCCGDVAEKTIFLYSDKSCVNAIYMYILNLKINNLLSNCFGIDFYL